MTNTDTPLTECEEIEAMLAWYVTGTLNAADRARVESWIARDASLARQLAIIEDDRMATVRSNEARALPASLSVQSAMKKIVGEPSASHAAAAGLLDRIRDFFTAPTAMGVRFATAAAAAVILLQAVWLGALMTATPPSQYQTASGGTAAVTDGTYALVRFADTATAKDIAAALQKLDMTIADGPKPGNLFRVRIGAKGLSSTDRDARIAALRSDGKLVILVTPASER